MGFYSVSIELFFGVAILRPAAGGYLHAFALPMKFLTKSRYSSDPGILLRRMERDSITASIVRRQSFLLTGSRSPSSSGSKTGLSGFAVNCKRGQA